MVKSLVCVPIFAVTSHITESVYTLLKLATPLLLVIPEPISLSSSKNSTYTPATVSLSISVTVAVYVIVSSVTTALVSVVKFTAPISSSLPRHNSPLVLSYLLNK